MTGGYDLIVVGAGAAGLPAAIAAAEAGGSVLLIEAAEVIGGTFHLSNGQMSAAGSRVQAARGIADSPDAHYADVMRINGNTGDPALIRLAVDNAAATLDWLGDLGLEMLPDHPVIYPGHDPYRTPRTSWGAEDGRSVMKVLVAALQPLIEAGRVTLWLETTLEAITVDGGAVTGVTVRRGDQIEQVAARSTLLATGGFAANETLFETLNHGQPLHSGSWRHARGDGLAAALAVGGTVVNAGLFLPIFAAVEDARAPGGYIRSTNTNPLLRPPWEIAVSDAGKRFYAEDNERPDHRERALAKLPGVRFWVIDDAAIRRAAPPLFDDPSLEGQFGRNPNYLIADSIEALANAAAMPAATLRATIEAYNRGVLDGTPDPLGRMHRPLPIAEPPFRAVRHFGWTIITFPGLGVDDGLQVIDGAGAPIPNLYAAGEILGFGATGGAAYTSGMSVTPAMTFGRLLGARLAARAAQPVEA